MFIHYHQERLKILISGNNIVIVLQINDIKIGSANKLVPNLLNESKYVLHDKNLHFYFFRNEIS